MRVKTIMKQIRRKIKGSLAIAVEDGMRVGTGVSVMGGVNFGSEPYLISLGNNVRISSNVTLLPTMVALGHSGIIMTENSRDLYNSVRSRWATAHSLGLAARLCLV